MSVEVGQIRETIHFSREDWESHAYLYHSTIHLYHLIYKCMSYWYAASMSKSRASEDR